MDEKGHKKYLKIEWRGKLYHYAELAFGLSPAPRIFTMILKPLLAKLRGQGHQSVAYLDDWYLQGKSYETCALNIRDTCVLLQKAGFHINILKSKMIPSRKIEFLGFELDSAEMTITLPLNKRQTVVQACEAIAHMSARIPIRVVARTIGVLVATFPAVPWGPLHFRSLEREKTLALKKNLGDYDGLMTLNEGRSYEHLQWWIENIQKKDHCMPPGT